MDLEKQLNTYIKSKPSQTPHSSLSLSGDLDKEMEKQYKIVCERNKWLENRISSLIREIDLLRDQNSLLTEEKKAAENQSEAMEGELKSVTISSKSSRKQTELENIHLQNSMAEKMQQVLELQRDLREKNQLIQAMSRQLENTQKKSDKNKISSFMKKLRKSSESIGVTSSPERGHPMHTSSTEPALSTLGNSALMLLPSAFSTQTFTDPGYSTMPMPGKGPKDKSNGNRNRSRSTPGDISKMLQRSQGDRNGDIEEMQPRSRSYHHLNQDLPEFPETLKVLSPSPTYPTSARRSENLMESFPDYISDTGEPIGSPIRRSPETVQTLPDPPRKRRDYHSRHDVMGDSSSADESKSDEGHVRRSLADNSEQFGRGSESDRKRSHSSDRFCEATRTRDRRPVISADEVEDGRDYFDKVRQTVSPIKQSRRSSDPMPEARAPSPTPAPVLPTPASSPSVLSPTSARNRSIHIHVTQPSDDGNGYMTPGPASEREKGRSPATKRSTSPGSLPSPPLTTGTPTKSRSSKMHPSDA